MSEPTPPLLPLKNSAPSAAPASPAVPQFDPNLFPPRHRPLRQLVLDHNPFLLLSTVCMLLGCFLVNSSLKDQDQSIKRMVLLAVMNLYEICIIPLGLVLIRRTRGVARDGWWLLLFEILFLVNATFINVDLGRYYWGWGFLFNGALFALACVKAAVLFRGLNIGLRLRTFGFFVLQLGIIYGLPIFFALVESDGVVSARILYACWWVVALLPFLYDQIARADRHPPALGLVQQVIRRVYLIVPWMILVLHLRFSHWAHYAEFSMADVAPLFLGLAVAADRFRAHGFKQVARALPVVALLLSVFSAETLHWSVSFSGPGVQEIVPFYLMLPAVLLTYCYMSSAFYFACACLALALMGLGYLCHNWLLAALRRGFEFILAHIPSTTFTWGVTSIILAFALLAIGSTLSLKRITPLQKAHD